MTTPISPVTSVLSGLDLHSPERRLIELKMAHADLNALIDEASQLATSQPDDLHLRRMKKQRLALRDQITLLQSCLVPKEPA